MTSAFWTDSERQKRLDEAFEMSGGSLHPNSAEFYKRYVLTLDAERAEHLIGLVNNAKARAIQAHNLG